MNGHADRNVLGVGTKAKVQLVHQVPYLIPTLTGKLGHGRGMVALRAIWNARHGRIPVTNRLGLVHGILWSKTVHGAVNGM
jgi:hypothetical protein